MQNTDNFYASATVRWCWKHYVFMSVLVSIRACVLPSIHDVVSAICMVFIGGFSPNFQTSVNSTSWDKDELVRFEVKRSKVKVTA